MLGEGERGQETEGAMLKEMDRRGEIERVAEIGNTKALDSDTPASNALRSGTIPSPQHARHTLPNPLPTHTHTEHRHTDTNTHKHALSQASCHYPPSEPTQGILTDN
jgi:hypothetical protein